MDERLMKAKKGQVTMFLIIILFGAFFGGIFLIWTLITSTTINSALDQNIQIGQVNLADANRDTFGKVNEMVTGKADFWGICIIFGMVIGLVLSGYFLRGKWPKIAVGLDIVIIFVAFLIALYLRSVYGTILSAFLAAGQSIAVSGLQKTNYFILNLPIFVGIIGVVTMVLTHMGIPRKEEELAVAGQVVAA